MSESGILRDPADYPRRILVSVTGLTPQVVTESLHVLVRTQNFVPTEIHLITTSNGRNRALRDLLDSQTGQFHAFCRDAGVSGRIRFDASMIHVIRDAEGNELPDIRTPQENTCAADAIVEFIQRYCRDDDAALHISLAGGRKTMGFFAGSALSLFGRRQDRLSHVLVSEPFENNRDFFYPAQTPREIFSQTGEPLDASSARVMLADIPYVRLRDGLPEELLNGRISYSDSVRTAQERITPPVSLSFSVKRRTALLGGTEVVLPPLLFSILLWLAVRRNEGLEPVRPGTNARAGEFLSVYARVVGKDSLDYEKALQALCREEYFLPYFQEKRSLVNRAVKAALGERRAQPYLIASLVKRLNTRYKLGLSPESIILPKGFP